MIDNPLLIKLDNFVLALRLFCRAFLCLKFKKAVVHCFLPWYNSLK
jgi:hypothetical protein